MYEVCVRMGFSAAHNLRNYKGKCEALHGHNYQVEVAIRGEKLENGGMLIDFSHIKSLMKEIIQRLDHTYLNEIVPFDIEEPSCENISRYIFQELKKRLPSNLKLYRVTVWESDDTCSSFLEP